MHIVDLAFPCVTHVLLFSFDVYETLLSNMIQLHLTLKMIIGINH